MGMKGPSVKSMGCTSREYNVGTAWALWAMGCSYRAVALHYGMCHKKLERAVRIYEVSLGVPRLQAGRRSIRTQPRAYQMGLPFMEVTEPGMEAVEEEPGKRAGTGAGGLISALCEL